MSRARSRTGALALAFLIAVGVALAVETPPPAQALQLSSDLRLVVRDGRDLELHARMPQGGTYEELAARLCGGAAQAEALRAYNGTAPRAGEWIRVPLALLSANSRGMALRNLFPGDRRHDGAWVHVVRSGRVPTHDVGLWQVAEWFTGRGQAFRDLMVANGLDSPELTAGQEIRIPDALLLPTFSARTRSPDGALEFASDERGPYAAYRLQPGEALYSAAVVRFTGRTGSEDVRNVAELVQERSGIADLRDIPAHFEVKIPLELLEPDFLPPAHPRRREAEARKAELAKALAGAPARGNGRGLEDVVVILDPGHGGRDLGTMNHGVWEHDYVYDVACRLKRRLEQETAARVMLTLMDMETGCEPEDRDKLTANRQGTILTSPNFLARNDGDAKVGVNLRWYLANSIYRKAGKDGVHRDRVVFLSLHADSRHPSLRGVMVYVPGANYRSKTYGQNSTRYRRYREVREKPQVQFSRKERLRSEAVSRELADAVVTAFGQASLPVQPYQPVRNKIIRGKQHWVPAVLRGNAVPTKVLVEMVNLSNPEDAKLLGAAAARERMAGAVFDGLLGYFGDDRPDVARAAAGP